MVSRLVALIITSALLTPNLSMAANNCSCPTIKADGKGNSSCSAAESAERCTIDYNLFSQEREQRAVEMLMRAAPESEVKLLDDSMNTVAALYAASEEGILIPVLLVYLAVAAADQQADFDSIDEDLLGVIVREGVAKRAEAISGAFSASTIEDWSGRPPPSPDEARNVIIDMEDGFVLAPGCVELWQDGLWVMFKANWSPVASLPRCGSKW